MEYVAVAASYTWPWNWNMLSKADVVRATGVAFQNETSPKAEYVYASTRPALPVAARTD